jgi:hypothetical protein
MFGAGRIFGIKHSFKLRPFSMGYITDYLPEYSLAANEEFSVFQQLMTPLGRELDELHQQSYDFRDSLALNTIDTLEQDWMYVHELNTLAGETLMYDRGMLVPPALSAFEPLEHIVNNVLKTEFEVESIKIVESYRDFVTMASPSRFVGSGVKVIKSRAEIVPPTSLLRLNGLSPIDLPEPRHLIVRALKKENEAHNLLNVDMNRVEIGETEIKISGYDASMNEIFEVVKLISTLPHTTRSKFHKITKIILAQAPLNADDYIVIRTIEDKRQSVIDVSRHIRLADDTFTNPMLRVDETYGNSRWPKFEELVSEEGFQSDLLKKQEPSLVKISDALVLMPADPDEPNSSQELPVWVDMCIPARSNYIAGLGFRNKNLASRKMLLGMWPKRTTSPTVFDDGSTVLGNMSQSSLIPESGFFAEIYEWTLLNTEQAQDQHIIKIPISIELDTPRGLYIVNSWNWTFHFPDGSKKYIDQTGTLINSPITIRPKLNDDRQGVRQDDFVVDLNIAYSDLLTWRDPSNLMLVRNHCIIELNYRTDDNRTETVKKMVRLPIRSAEYIYSDIEKLTGPTGSFVQANLKSDNLRVLHNVKGEGHFAVALFTSSGMEYVDLVDRFDKALVDLRDSSIMFRENYKSVDIDFTGGA